MLLGFGSLDDKHSLGGELMPYDFQFSAWVVVGLLPTILYRGLFGDEMWAWEYLGVG